MSIFSKKIFILLLILLTTAVIYFPSTRHAFTHLDDYEQVVNNPLVREFSFSKLQQIFTQSTVGMYQPISSLFYALTYSIFGSEAQAFHLLSLFFHLLNVILVFKILGHFKLSDYVLFGLTALFSLHPLQVEAICWVSAFSTLSFTFFYLLAFYSYISIKENKLKHITALTLFLLSCLSKSAAISLPLAIIAYDYLILKEKKWLQMIPYLFISLCFGFLTIHFRESAGHLSELSVQFSVFEHFLIVCRNLLYYPIKFILPIQLSAFYPFPDQLDWTYFIAPIAIITLLILIKRIQPSKWIWLGICYYLFNIALVSQIIPVGQQITTDRYNYTVSLGFLFILIPLIQFLDKKKLKYLITVPFVLFLILSFNRTKVWSDDERIWSDVIEQYPKVAQAHNNLGSYYNEKGQTKMALDYYSKAIKLRSNYADAYANRGGILGNLGKSSAAIKDLNRALQLKPHADAYFNRGNEFMKQQQFELALEDYTKSLVLKKSADTYTNKAYAYFQMNNLVQAEKMLDSALILNSGYGSAHYLKGLINYKNGRLKSACVSFQKAVQLNHPQAQQAIQQFCNQTHSFQ